MNKMSNYLSWNDSNLVNDTEMCLQPQAFVSFSTFLNCYGIIFRIKSVECILELSLAFITVVLNSTVVWSILSELKTRPLNMFDQILVGQAIVNGVTGLVDISLYHFCLVFGYWPFGWWLRYLWLDYIYVDWYTISNL